MEYASMKVKKKEEQKSCTTEHQPGRCPAYWKDCYTCGEKNHFARSSTRKGKSVKRVRAAETTRPYSATLLGKKFEESQANARKIVTVKKVQNTNDLWSQ